MPAGFDHYVIVDWSAENQKKTGRDSIWICHRGPQGEHCTNPPTRHLAKQALSQILAQVTARSERVVLGFDFPFGYPAGFARRLGLDGGKPWRAVWDEIARLLRDDENNRNNRFRVAAAFNERVSGKAFPFWGCPPAQAGAFLGPRHHNGHATGGLDERRLIDRWMVGAQPCWKLAYTGSVGSQALTGIPVVRALRDDPRWADEARIWPFETGLRLAADARIVFAECWPSWWRSEIRAEWGPPNDKAQVRSVAALVAARDAGEGLAAWFAGGPDLTAAQRRIVESEEAWTLGVTAPRLPAGTRRGSRYRYLRDPAAIYRRSFALVRAEADLARFPVPLRPVALRLAHAAGDVRVLDDLAWSDGAAVAGRQALHSGAPIVVDSAMTAAGIIGARLPAANAIVCTLARPEVATLAAAHKTTLSAAAVELWRPYLKGAVVAIGNAPTALFRLLEILAEGGESPALVLGFPVGFVGATEAKLALAQFGRGVAYLTLHGRRGGSALAAAAVNALAAPAGRRPQ